ncbi:MAG: hypothetical protein J2P57_04920 [Acidimicrobiaceae bacterium]|nr:hypothetical protein [Acidimicrobiaceae bacterium]
MTARALPSLTEKEWQRQVVHLAQLHGWECWHPWLSIHSPRGFPDLVMVRPPRIVAAELKRDTGKLTPAQEHWLDLLGACPQIEAYEWRPSDFEEVERVLRRTPP